MNGDAAADVERLLPRKQKARKREPQRRGRDSNPRWTGYAHNGFRDLLGAAWIWLARAILRASGAAEGQCLGQSRTGSAAPQRLGAIGVAYACRDASSIAMPTTRATRSRSASWASNTASRRHATAAIMQSTIPRGVTPAARQRR